MTRLSLRPHREQQLLLDVCTTTAPRTAPAAHLTGDHSRRPVDFDDIDVFDGMPAGWRPGRAHDDLGDGYGTRVMRHLRAEDAMYLDLTAARAKLLVPLHRPASGLPALLAEAERVVASRDAACRALFAEGRKRREAIATAAWIDAADDAEMTASAAAVVAAFAVRPELRHDTALLMALAPVVTMLNGSVA